MQHHFDISIATNYGVNVAIFLNNLAFWIQKNQANNKHYHDGRYWTYNTIKAYSVLFPYWTPRQVERLINKCVKDGLILRANHNDKQYDRTCWYGLTDKSHKLLNIPISPNGEMDFTKKRNGFHQTVKPIPDRNTYKKPNNIFLSKRIDSQTKKITKIDCPPDLKPTQKNIEYCSENNLNCEIEFEKFKNHYQSHGKKFASWGKAFNNWLIKANEINKNIQRGQKHERKETATERMHRMLGLSTLKKPSIIDLDKGAFHKI